MIKKLRQWCRRKRFITAYRILRNEAERHLLRECEPGDPRESPVWKGSRPCDCGRIFYDIYRSTIYPHERVIMEYIVSIKRAKFRNMFDQKVLVADCQHIQHGKIVDTWNHMTAYKGFRERRRARNYLKIRLAEHTQGH